MCSALSCPLPGFIIGLIFLLMPVSRLPPVTFKEYTNWWTREMPIYVVFMGIDHKANAQIFLDFFP